MRFNTITSVAITYIAVWCLLLAVSCFLIVVSLAILLFPIWAIYIIVSKEIEKYRWNNGVSRKSGDKWEFVGCNSKGYRAYTDPLGNEIVIKK